MRAPVLKYIRMVLLWGTLFLVSHYCVHGQMFVADLAHGRDSRQLQAPQVDIAALRDTLANATTETQAQLLALGDDRSVADNSIPVASAKSPVVPLLYYLQRNPLLPMDKIFDEGYMGIGTQWWHTLLGILIPTPILLLACGLTSTCWLCLSQRRHTGDLQLGVDQKPQKPSLAGVGQTSCYAAVLILALTCVSVGSFFNTIVAINGVISDLQPEASYINETLDALQPEIHNANLWLSNWMESCVGWDLIKANAEDQPIFQEVIAKNEEYVNLLNNQTMTIYNVTEKVQAIPRYIKEARDIVTKMMNWQMVVGGIFVLPTVCLLLGLLWCIRGAQHQDAKSLQQMHDDHGDRWFKCLVCCNCLVVLGAFFICSISLLVGLFCWNTEVNTVHLASAFQYGNGTSTGTQIVSYYLTGDPAKNEIVEALKQVRNILDTVANSLWLLKPALNVVGLVCEHIGYVDPSKLLGDAVPRINQILPLTKRDRVYYFFDELTNRAVCKNAANSLTMTLASQIAIGLFLVPYVGVQINKYLQNMKAYKNYLATATANEKQALLKSGYHCTNCRAGFNKLEQPRQEMFSNYDEAMKTYTMNSTKFEEGAKALQCPDCQAQRTLKPGVRKLNVADESAVPKCSVM